MNEIMKPRWIPVHRPEVPDKNTKEEFQVAKRKIYAPHNNNFVLSFTFLLTTGSGRVFVNERLLFS